MQLMGMQATMKMKRKAATARRMRLRAGAGESEETQKDSSHDSFFFLPTVAFWKIVETSSLCERQRGAFVAALKGTGGVPAMTSHYIRMLIIKNHRK